MKEAVWIFVGVFALIVSGPTVYLGALEERIRPETAAVGSAFSLSLWAVWSLQAWSVETVANNGEIVVHSYQSLGYLGAVAAVVCLYALIKASVAALDVDLGVFG